MAMDELRRLCPSDSEKMLKLALSKCGNDTAKAAQLLKRARAKYEKKKKGSAARPPSTPLTRSSAGASMKAAARSPSSLVAAQMGTPVGRSVRAAATPASSSRSSSSSSSSGGGAASAMGGTPAAVRPAAPKPLPFTSSWESTEEPAFVVRTAKISGDVTIASGAIVHPHCTIDGTGGPIVIGAGSIIEELACIINDVAGSAPLQIGAHCLLEVGARVGCGAVIGAGCHLEPRCVVGARATLGDGCIVGATVELPEETTLAACTIAFFLSSAKGHKTRALPPGDAAEQLAAHERYRQLLIRRDAKGVSHLGKFNDLHV